MALANVVPAVPLVSPPSCVTLLRPVLPSQAQSVHRETMAGTPPACATRSLQATFSMSFTYHDKSQVGLSANIQKVSRSLQIYSTRSLDGNFPFPHTLTDCKPSVPQLRTFILRTGCYRGATLLALEGCVSPHQGSVLSMHRNQSFYLARACLVNVEMSCGHAPGPFARWLRQIHGNHAFKVSEAAHVNYLIEITMNWI
eukprot:1799820-Amphidinium_carterae.1